MLTPYVSSGVSETEFLTYKGTFGDNLSGKMDTNAGSVSVTLEGQGSSKLESCFGKLKKEELDVKKLLYDSSNRCKIIPFFYCLHVAADGNRMMTSSLMRLTP